MKKKTRYIYAALIMLGFAVFINGMGYVITRPKTFNDENLHFPIYKNTMKQEDAESVLSVIDAEGFDNTFNHLATFRDIGDHRFHELRRAYVNAAQELKDYLAEAAHRKNDIPYYLRNYKNENRN
jgi:hypothetical protein